MRGRTCFISRVSLVRSQPPLVVTCEAIGAYATSPVRRGKGYPGIIPRFPSREGIRSMAARNTSPTYQFHKASGQARIYYPGGQTKLIGPYNSPESRVRFDELCAAWHRAGGNAPVKVAPDLTVGTALRLWIMAMPSLYDPASPEPPQFDRIIGELAKQHGALPARDFRAKDLESFREHLVGLGWNRRTVARQIIRVRTVWRWLEKEGHVPAGSWDHLRTVRAVSRNAPAPKAETPPTFEAVKATLPYLRGPVRAMVLLQWWSGMRPSEVTRLRPADLDRESMPGVWVYQPAQHKNDWRPGRRAESIVLGPKAQAAMQRWLRWDEPDLPIFRPVDAVAEQMAERLARRTGPGKKRKSPGGRKQLRSCYQAETYARAIARACQLAGVSWHPYQLRHACKMRIARLISTEAARAVLRHRHINTTQLYGSRDLESAADAMRKFG